MIGKNNPLNIRYSPLNNWLGQTGQTRGFCDFESVAYCLRSVGYLLMVSYQRKGAFTYAQLIGRFAPRSENATDNYIAFVCDKLHVYPFDCPENYEDFANMIYYMWRFEQGEWPNTYVTKIRNVLMVCFQCKEIKQGKLRFNKFYPLKIQSYEKDYFDRY